GQTYVRPGQHGRQQLAGANPQPSQSKPERGRLGHGAPRYCIRGDLAALTTPRDGHHSCDNSGRRSPTAEGRAAAPRRWPTVLTKEQNERFARVGPGTACGELMRRYWHPLAAVSWLRDRSTMKVRLLGEDFILYRDLG